MFLVANIAANNTFGKDTVKNEKKKSLKSALISVFKPLHHPGVLSYHSSGSELQIFYKEKIFIKGILFSYRKNLVESIFFLFSYRKTS